METGLPEEGYDRVVQIVHDVRPDTILTFGPDGMTDHAAHKSVSSWATRALREAGGAGSRVLHATVTQDWAQEFLPVWEPFDVFRPGTPWITPREELVIDYRLPREINELKVRAILEHVSQVQAIFEAVGEEIWWRQMSREMFRLGETKP
jgi:LmbE family N-acetylglucosaminyl deacetylase